MVVGEKVTALTFFFNRKFTSHRLFGLAFLLQYLYVIYLYIADYEDGFRNSFVIVTMPLTGVIQAVNATLTFTFLPKKQVDGGYFSYKPGNTQGTLSYAFIKENIFFAALLCFQWWYYDDRLYPWIKKAWPLECLFVFIPYVIRSTYPDLFPRTRFRDSMENQTGEGQTFYYYLTWFTKGFYLWAKHYLGFFLNYYRYLNLATAYDQRCMHGILICSSFATTIAIFLHTLRFKGYIDPKVSLVAYVVSYMSTFVGYAMIFHVFGVSPLLSLMCLMGIFVNLYSYQAFDVFQVVVMLMFLTYDHWKDVTL